MRIPLVNLTWFPLQIYYNTFTKPKLTERYKMIDWHQKYTELVKQFDKLDKATISEAAYILKYITNKIEWTRKEKLADEGKAEYLELTEDISIAPTYNDGRIGLIQTFKKGTLLDATINGDVATIYLDDDGDGFLNFPTNVLKKVIRDIFLNEDVTIIYQG